MLTTCCKWLYRATPFRRAPAPGNGLLGARSAATRGAAGSRSRLSWCSVLQCSSCVTTPGAAFLQQLSWLAGHGAARREGDPWVGRECPQHTLPRLGKTSSPLKRRCSALLGEERGHVPPGGRTRWPAPADEGGICCKAETVIAVWPLAGQTLHKNL